MEKYSITKTLSTNGKMGASYDKEGNLFPLTEIVLLFFSTFFSVFFYISEAIFACSGSRNVSGLIYKHFPLPIFFSPSGPMVKHFLPLTVTVLLV